MYKGQSILIPMGGGGLISDLPQSRMPPTHLIEATNVTLVNGYCEKHPGTRVWNRDNINAPTTLPAGVQFFQEYFPQPFFQRVIVLLKNGEIYKFNSQYSRQKVTPQFGAPASLITRATAHMAIGGAEQGGAPKKVFIFSGGSQVQVITDDQSTYRPIQKPAADWSASYPKFGLIYRSRMWCFGNESAADFVYASAEGDHEDFQKISAPAAAGDAQFFDVSPGEGSGVSGMFVFKNRLFVCKSPTGLYQLNDEDANPATWYFTRVNADFGLSSSHGIAQVFDDVFIFNTQGTVTSVSAAFQFGDIKSADVFNKLKVERYFRQLVSGFGIPETHGLYYQDKKQVYFTFRSKSAVFQDRIAVMDLFGESVQITILDKDQPNCLGSIQDVTGIARPIYGANDGNLYELDCPNRWIQPTQNDDFYVLPGYWEDGYVVDFAEPYEFVAQTPHMDFGFADQSVGLKTKRFDFLEITFQPTGSWNVDVDVYIDSEFKETIQFNLNRDRPLAPYVPPPGQPYGFQLDADRLDGDFPKSIRKPLHGQGRTISFKLRSNGLSENIKIQSLMVYFRVADERQIKDPR